MAKENETPEVNQVSEDEVKKLQNEINNVEGMSPEQKEQVKEVVDEAVEAGNQKAKEGAGFADVKKTMNDKFNKALEGIKNFSEKVWNKIKEIWNKFIKAVEKGWNKTLEGPRNLAGKVKNIGKNNKKVEGPQVSENNVQTEVENKTKASKEQPAKNEELQNELKKKVEGISK